MTINIFIENMVDIVCSRCSHKCPRPRNLWHHNGVFNKYIKSDIKIDEIFFSNYFNDIEHGFFHAFCCCYISYILTNHDNKQIGFNIKDRIETKKTDAIKRHNYKEDKHPLNIRLIASLLLHDFLKCNGFSQEEHDKELKKYYSKLLPETYTHSSPSLEDDNKLLICVVVLYGLRSTRTFLLVEVPVTTAAPPPVKLVIPDDPPPPEFIKSKTFCKVLLVSNRNNESHVMSFELFNDRAILKRLYTIAKNIAFCIRIINNPKGFALIEYLHTLVTDFHDLVTA